MGTVKEQVFSLLPRFELYIGDTYVIDVDDPGDALCALMLTLAIDAEKCSRN